MPHLPDLPQFPDLDSPEERRAFERKAAEEAMESEHHAFAGRARHVGGVEFDDPGVYEIADVEVDPDVLGAYAEPVPQTAAHPPVPPETAAMTPEKPENRETDDRASARREWKGDRSDEPAGELYMPSEVGSTRMRQQGLGMGEEELRLQRDPARERHTRGEIPGGEPEAAPPPRRPETRR